MSADNTPPPEPAPAPDPLLEKLLTASRDANPVAKAGENKAQSYNYARAEDVIAEARRALHAAGLVAVIDCKPAGSSEITSSSGSRGLLVRVDATLRVLDPSSGRAMAINGAGTGTDYPGDKAVYKAMTGAAKYLYASALGIPFGDDPESGEHVERSAASSPPAGPPKGFSGPDQSSAFVGALGEAVRSDEERQAVLRAVNAALTATQIDNAGSQLLNPKHRSGAVRKLRELAGLEPLDLSVPDTRDLPDVDAAVANSQAPLHVEERPPVDDFAPPPIDDPFAPEPTEADPSL